MADSSNDNAPSRTEPGASTSTADISRILGFLPHRYPFLLVDKVVDWRCDQWLHGVKNVTFNEPYFQGHFPGHPVMPGVLILEALAQASGVLAQLSAEQKQNEGTPENPLYYLVKIDKARFNRVVVPGDQLHLHVNQKRMIRRMGLSECEAKVDGKVVASAEILCAERAR